VRILGVDPGLTRCGLGVIDVDPRGAARLVFVDVVRTPAKNPLGQRLAYILERFETVLAHHDPQALALERVFAQDNVASVMGTAQVSGVILAAATRASVNVETYTPSEVKAAVTGSGRANKAQVGVMVARALGLTQAPEPADAADALAIALTHARRTPVRSPSRPATQAQRQWQEAESRARAQK